MKFTSQSLKPDLKPQNEDFLFERKTPRGKFFALLDFEQHDFANLNTTLEAKLETIVGSFATLQQFSADLFLGFIAKEINNFLYSLGQHSGEHELLCSASLCLVSGNRLSYFTCGDASMVLINQDRMLPLAGIEAVEADQNEQLIRQLGQHEQESPLIDQVQHSTLKEGDVVLIMTSGIASEFEGQTLVNHVSILGALEPKIICDKLMEASETSQEDRTLVVIAGPYETDGEPVVADVSKTGASLERRINSLKEGAEIAGLLQSNARIDESRLLELDQKLESLSVVLANKADTTELLGLQSEVLKLGVLAKETSGVKDTEPLRAGFSNGEVSETLPLSASGEGVGGRREAVVRPSSGWRPVVWVALLLVVGIAGGFIGGWIHASRTERVAEAWTVKTSGNQIVISRLSSEASPSIVTINTVQPLRSTGEQTFSSFADVKQYLDTITPPEPPAKAEEVKPEPQTITQAQPKPSPITPQKETKPTEIVTSIAFRQGDSLKTLAQRYNVAPAKLIALNPNITRWSLLKPGQRVVVPAGPVNRRNVSQQAPSSGRPTNPATRKVTVEAGDTLDKLANRHNLSPSRLKELNPQITNWSRIQAGQKVLVPSPVRG